MQSVQALRGSSFFLVFLGGLIALAPLSIDAYMPALPDMAIYFGVEIAAVNLTLTTYLLGSALGQLFGGALSDHLGRRPVGLVGLLLFVIASLLITAATDIGQVWALRALQALGGGAASVVCMAQVRDVYPANLVPKKIANVMLVMLVAPMVAPTIGAVLMQLGWKSVFYFLAAYTGFYLLVYFFYLPETNARGRRALTLSTLLGSYIAVLRHRVRGKPVAQRLTAFSACGAGIFLSYLTNAAFIYMQHFGLGEFEFAAAFAAGGLAIMAGNRVAAALMGRHPPLRILRWANTLHLVVVAAGVAGSWLLPHSLPAGMAVLFLIMGIGGAVAPSASGFYMSLFDENAGSAASLSTTLIFMVGALFGALAALLSADGLTPIFLVMLAAGTLARLALPRQADAPVSPKLGVS